MIIGRGILKNSIVIKWLLSVRSSSNIRIEKYLSKSIVAKQVIEFKKGLYFSPVKTVSIIVVTAILLNMLSYVLFASSIHNKSGLSGWIIKCFLLFTGFAGLFCEAGLKPLVSSSFFTRWVKRNKQHILEEK